MSRTEAQSSKIFYNCPGAWYGNMPEQSSVNDGNVTVDASLILPATTYLKRYYRVKGTRSSRESGGIVIDITVKGLKVKSDLQP